MTPFLLVQLFILPQVPMSKNSAELIQLDDLILSELLRLIQIRGYFARFDRYGLKLDAFTVPTRYGFDLDIIRIYRF